MEYKSGWAGVYSRLLVEEDRMCAAVWSLDGK